MGKWEDYDLNPPDNTEDEYDYLPTQDDYELEPYDYDENLMPYEDEEMGMSRHSFYATDEDLEELEEDEDGREYRDYHPIRPRRDGKTGCLGGMMYAVFVISMSIICACLAWMAAADVLALNKPEHSEIVVVEKDFEMDDIISQLKDNGLIEYKFLFKLFAKVAKAEEKINPGTYELNTSLDYRALVSKMQTGSEAQQITTITFPEGYTMAQIFEKLEEENICSVDDLRMAAATYNYTYSFLEDLPTGEPERLEGYLFPDTYDFYEGEQASTVINKFLRVFHYRMTAEIYELTEEMGRTFDEIITIASIIEKEAGSDEERARMASVIYNRLEIGMNLQIDATIQYFLPERKLQLTNEELAIDNPYNTYMYSGLPPGPISNPGLASIYAAVKPESTNYLFYALDTATGTHKFSVTKEEHDAFTATQNYDQ